MGLGLAVGVATEIFIRKDSYTKEEIIDKIRNYFNLDLYDIEEDDQYISLIIKLKIFKDNIYDFLNSEVKYFKLSDKQSVYFNDTVQKLQKINNIEEVKEIIKSDKSYRLNFLEGNIIETISYISDSELKIFSNLIVYNFSYKVYMEEYCEFFRYVRAKMQQSINNVLKDDVFLMLATG